MSKANVLLIAGHNNYSSETARALRAEGYSLKVAARVETAAELMITFRPELILIDCRFEENPLLWLEKTRRSGLAGQVIALTDRPDFDLALEWLARGLFGVLTQPLDYALLARKCSEALALSKICVKSALHPAENAWSGIKSGPALSLADFYRGLAGRIDLPELKTYLLDSLPDLTGAARAELRLSAELTAACHLDYHIFEAGELMAKPPPTYIRPLKSEGEKPEGFELSFQGRILGQLYLHFKDAGELDSAKRAGLRAIISACAAALDAAGRFHKAASLSCQDPLTGLYNRRVFEEVFKREFFKAQRHNFNLSLLCLDLDHFKLVNDKFGHQRGDLVLKAVGLVLGQAARSSDLPARLGGEEFAVLLPHTSQQQALVFGARIRKLLSECRFDFAPEDFRQTISQGIAGLEHFMIKSPEDMLYWSDQALYLAKREGRDTIRLASDLPLASVMKDGAYAFQ